MKSGFEEKRRRRTSREDERREREPEVYALHCFWCGLRSSLSEEITTHLLCPPSVFILNGWTQRTRLPFPYTFWASLSSDPIERCFLVRARSSTCNGSAIDDEWRSRSLFRFFQPLWDLAVPCVLRRTIRSLAGAEDPAIRAERYEPVRSQLRHQSGGRRRSSVEHGVES